VSGEPAKAVFGTIINVHNLGATVRLEDGTLGAIPAPEVAANRTTLVRAMNKRERVALRGAVLGRHRAFYLAEPGVPESGVEASEAPRPFVPRLVDAEFERQLSDYLKSTEDWAPTDRPPPAERHFIRKKRRSVRFEARSEGT
jgi:hypothetical protein